MWYRKQRKNIDNQELNSYDFGRTGFLPPSTKEKRALKESSDSKKSELSSGTLRETRSLYKKLFGSQYDNEDRKEVPLIQRINLDLSFARVGTWMMLAKIFLSNFISDEDASNPSKVTVFKFLDDAFKKIRQIAQYSIHAQPGLGQREPDDIASDLVHNLEAASLGKSVYSLNAFFAPWLSVAKVFFPYNESLGLGLISRAVDFTDNTIGKVTNIFWNLRRITKGLIPYDGGLTTEKLISKQSEVRQLMSYYWQKNILGPIAAMKQVFVKNPRYAFEENGRRILLDQLEKDNKFLKDKSVENYFNNIKAFLTGKYTCPHEDGEIEKSIGLDEPENQRWYVRSKILSQIISLPAGLIGTALNSVGIGFNFFGNLFANHALRSLSDKCTDYANGLMSLVYITGEVPANVNEFFRKVKKGIPVIGEKGEGAIRNLFVAGSGVIGMVNRMKVLPGISQIFTKIGLKPILDSSHRILENFFLFFFSYNRLVLHSDERKEQGDRSSAREIEKANKHENLWKHISLPFRVMFGDQDVTYGDEDMVDIEDLNEEIGMNEFNPYQNLNSSSI